MFNFRAYFLKYPLRSSKFNQSFSSKCVWGWRLILRNRDVWQLRLIFGTFLPPLVPFYLLSVGSDAERRTPLTASEPTGHQPQPVGIHTAATQHAFHTDVVFAAQSETSQGGAAVEDEGAGGRGGGGEWEPEALDCYSIDLDSTWEVVEKVRWLYKNCTVQ